MDKDGVVHSFFFFFFFFLGGGGGGGGVKHNNSCCSTGVSPYKNYPRFAANMRGNLG